ncbi:hypothetical protein GCM10028805_07010 [Spirosoma harenae]
MDSSSTSGYVFHPAALQAGSAEESLLVKRFSARSLRIAQAMGLTPKLVQLLPLEADTAGHWKDARYLALRQQITDQIQLANFDVASTAAVLDCEARRASQAADLLTKRDNSRVKQITIAAITVGAFTALLGGVLQIQDINPSSEYVDIGGGLLEAGLGSSVFWLKPYQLSYQHPANPLQAIWVNQSNIAHFPPIVWYYLTHALSGGTSIAQQLRANWQPLVAEEKKRHLGRKTINLSQESLYFQSGGPYSAEKLLIRTTMLNQLETQIRLMNTDLTILLNELVVAKPSR